MSSSSKNRERARKILAIALDMHQPKEMRIQAVRVLKAMGAIDELWAVVHNVKCPFTRQSAIDCIPALEFKGQMEQINDRTFIPINMGPKEEGRRVTTYTKMPKNELAWP